MGRRRALYESPLSPDVRTLAKIGSIVAHVSEFYGAGGHEFDLTAIKALLCDEDVRTWLEDMEKLAMIPKPRSPNKPEAKPRG